MGYLIIFIVVAIAATLVRNTNKANQLTELKWLYEQQLKELTSVLH